MNVDRTDVDVTCLYVCIMFYADWSALSLFLPSSCGPRQIKQSKQKRRRLMSAKQSNHKQPLMMFLVPTPSFLSSF